MQALTETQHAEYNRLKKIVLDNWQETLEFFSAIRAIKVNRLYRAEFETWEAFCQTILHISVRHTDRLISASELEDKKGRQIGPIGPIKANAVPTSPETENEAQARELARVPPEKRPDVLSKARAEGLSAASIAKAAEEVCAPAVQAIALPAKPDIELDSTGFPIPTKCLELWKRRPEVQKVLTALSTVRTALRAAQEAQDPLWQPVTSKGETWSKMINAMDQAYASVGLAIPYAVCPYCQGQVADRCGNCQGRGFISEFFFKNCVSSDAKKIRATVCKTKP